MIVRVVNAVGRSEPARAPHYGTTSNPAKSDSLKHAWASLSDFAGTAAVPLRATSARSLRPTWRMISMIAAIVLGTASALANATKEAEQQRADPVLYATALQYFPDKDSKAPPKRIFRLTRDQIDATVQALLPEAFKTSVKQVMNRDPLQTNFEYAELLNFNAANIGGYSGWVSEIAARVKEKPATVINCEAQKNADDCLETGARAFALKAFRGDVSEEKLRQIAQFHVSGAKTVGYAQATAELVEVVLHSPHFLFRKELDVDKHSRLSPPQLLQAVTYTLADASPERLKLESRQADVYLKTGAEAAPTIRSILASAEAREKLVRFFKAWLELKEPGEFTISQQTFPEFTPQLASAMLAETEAYLRAELSKPNPRLTDITQSSHTYASKALEAIYGTKAASPDGSKPVKLDPAQRFGIFSQPAVLASHSGPTNTRLVKRGVFWVRKVMCMELDPPPNDVHKTDYEEAKTTERKRIEDMTQIPACIGCHKVINPFGFFQESWDALGRWRTLDNGHPIDASVNIDFLDEDPVQTKSPVEALKTFTDSAMFKQCFVRQLFRYYMGRQEESYDHAVLRRMFFEFAHEDRQDILRAVYQLVASDRIVRRQ